MLWFVWLKVRQVFCWHDPVFRMWVKEGSPRVNENITCGRCGYTCRGERT